MTFELSSPAAGKLSVAPATIGIDDPVSITLTWTVTDTAIHTGGCVRFQVPQSFVTPQIKSPLQPAFCRVECSKPDVALSLSLTREGNPKDSAYVTIWGKSVYVSVVSGELECGDMLTFYYGLAASEKTEPFAYVEPTPAPFFTGRHFFSVAIDPDGTRQAEFSGMIRSTDFPEIIVTPGPVVETKEIDTIRGTATVSFDKKGNPVSTTWQNKTNHHFCKTGHQICFGDIHCHSMYSDGLWSPDECYRFAKEVIGLDFCAVTDHVVQMSDDEWNETLEINKKWHCDGSFVTLVGYELNYPGIGDKNIYYPGDSGLLLRDREWGTENLIDPHSHVDTWLNQGAIMMSHLHAGNLSKFYVPELCKLVEIYSNWGNCEQKGAKPTFIPSLRTNFDGQWATNALEYGWKIAFTGNSDDHMARPGWSGWHRIERVYHGGLTAVYTTEPTRKGIFHALKNRHTYATSGSRIIVEATMNGALPGSELTSTELLNISYYLKDSSPIEKIELVHNGKTVQTKMVNGTEASGDFVYEPNNGSYYLRVTQLNGHHAWTSPWYLNN